MNFSCDTMSILAADVAPEPPAPDPTILASEALAAVAKTYNQSHVQCKW
jgi:hypothetical protein